MWNFVVLGIFVVAGLYVLGVTLNARWQARQRVLNEIAENTRTSAAAEPGLGGVPDRLG